jgi:hypothetical protein
MVDEPQIEFYRYQYIYRGVDESGNGKPFMHLFVKLTSKKKLKLVYKYGPNSEFTLIDYIKYDTTESLTTTSVFQKFI